MASHIFMLMNCEDSGKVLDTQQVLKQCLSTTPSW